MKSAIDRVCAVSRVIERTKLLIERADQGEWIQKAGLRPPRVLSVKEFLEPGVRPT